MEGPGFIHEDTMTTLTEDKLQGLTEEHNAWMEATGRSLFPAARQAELLELGALRCPSCRTVRATQEFSRDRSRRTGYSGRCRECDSEKHAAYSPEQGRARWQRYYRKHREKLNAYDRDRYRNDEHRRLSHQLLLGHRRCIRAGNPAEWIEPEQLLEHWESLGVDPLLCYLTGERLTPRTRSLDHVVAVSKGGAHALYNLMPSTFPANHRKGVRPLV